jgi:truncated hemoglobin YjbI
MKLTDDERREKHQRAVETAIASLRHRLYRRVVDLEDIGERHMGLLNYKLAGKYHNAVAHLRKVASSIGKIGEDAEEPADLTTAELANLYLSDRERWAEHMRAMPDAASALTAFSDVLAYIERKCALITTTARDPEWTWNGAFKDAATYFVTR